MGRLAPRVSQWLARKPKRPIPYLPDIQEVPSPSDDIEEPQDKQDCQDRLHLASPPVGPTTVHVPPSSSAIAMGFSLPTPPEKAIHGPTWGFPGHQGQDVALPELLVAVEEDDRTEAPGLAHPPQRRPADAQHLADLFLGKQAFFRLLGPLPELGRAPAAGQDGLAVLQRNGWVKFKGGFYKAMEGGKHQDPYRRKVRDRQGAGTGSPGAIPDIGKIRTAWFKSEAIPTPVSELVPKGSIPTPP